MVLAETGWKMSAAFLRHFAVVLRGVLENCPVRTAGASLVDPHELRTDNLNKSP